jgi:hypothetical protein
MATKKRSSTKPTGDVLRRLQAIEARLAGVEGGTRTSAGRNDPSMRHRIFVKLFDDTRLVVELGDALRVPDPVAVNAVLAKANDGVNPEFNATQIDGLRDVWITDAFKLIAPHEGFRIQLEAYWFWRELFAMLPDEVEGFHTAIVTWAASRTHQNWQNVVIYLDRLGLERRWTVEHAEALVQINRDDIKYKSLKWFGIDGDVW